jgi:cell division protein FtsB
MSRIVGGVTMYEGLKIWLAERFDKNSDTLFVISFKAVLVGFISFLIWFFQDLYCRVDKIEDQLTGISVNLGVIIDQQRDLESSQLMMIKKSTRLEKDMADLKKNL